MTINKLIKELQKLEKLHGPRAYVTIDKKGNRNLDLGDNYSHVSLQNVSSQSINWNIEGSSVLANGEERTRTVIVLNQE